MGRSRKITTEKNTKRRKPLLPIVGIVLALAFAFFAYLLTSPVRTFLVSRRVSFGGIPANMISPLIGVAIWLVLFLVAMFFVALLVGRDPVEDQAIKFNKEALKRREQQKVEREMKRQRQRDIRNQSRKG